MLLIPYILNIYMEVLKRSREIPEGTDIEISIILSHPTRDPSLKKLNQPGERRRNPNFHP